MSQLWYMHGYQSGYIYQCFIQVSCVESHTDYWHIYLNYEVSIRSKTGTPDRRWLTKHVDSPNRQTGNIDTIPLYTSKLDILYKERGKFGNRWTTTFGATATRGNGILALCLGGFTFTKRIDWMSLSVDLHCKKTFPRLCFDDDPASILVRSLEV